MPEAALSTRPIYSARPTLRLAGEADLRLTHLLTAMRMEESEGGMSHIELRFSNLVSLNSGATEAAFDANADLKLGAAIEVYGGDTQAPVEIFRGKVSAIELLYTMGAAPELTVLAEDALFAARLARRSKVYTDMSLADVVREVAQALHLQPTITGLTEPVGTWAQINESDLAFLRRLLARFDADLQIVGDALQVSPRGDVARGEIELAMFGQLVRARVLADVSQQITQLSTAGWNPVDGSAVSHEASALTHGGPGSGRSGAAWLEEAFGARSEHVGHLAVATQAEAEAVASAAFDQRARRFVRIEGMAEGNPALRVGTTVAVSGLSSQFDNSYYVCSAQHLYDQTQGYRTGFTAECAWLGEGT
ncbi:phage late control D family protein [Hydrogenophaga sp.]|uniref:phage late control D family protein n=1 Tax=Hydrogenophaga sp. TaxID=1904254 RepID=UPI0035621AF5